MSFQLLLQQLTSSRCLDGIKLLLCARLPLSQRCRSEQRPGRACHLGRLQCDGTQAKVSCTPQVKRPRRNFGLLDNLEHLAAAVALAENGLQHRLAVDNEDGRASPAGRHSSTMRRTGRELNGQQLLLVKLCKGTDWFSSPFQSHTSNHQGRPRWRKNQSP